MENKNIQPYKSNFNKWIQRLEDIERRTNEGVVYLVLDTSSSMGQWEKLAQVKLGALNFAKDAQRKDYSVGLIHFNSHAFNLCEPQRDSSILWTHLQKLTSKGSTNMVEALYLAKEHLIRKAGLRATLIATDGMPDDPEATLNVAKRIKEAGIEILVIATSDADKEFLDRLASRKDLAVKVAEHQFKEAISSSTKLLYQLPKKEDRDNG